MLDCVVWVNVPTLVGLLYCHCFCFLKFCSFYQYMYIDIVLISNLRNIISSIYKDAVLTIHYTTKLYICRILHQTTQSCEVLYDRLLLKHCWKEKMLFTSILSFSYNVFRRLFLKDFLNSAV